MRIGTFYEISENAFEGSIGALGLGTFDVSSREMQTPEGRSYLRLIGDPMGASFEIGAAFPKEKNGMKYFSVSLESPFLTKPVNAALFPDRENTGSYNLVWERPEDAFSNDPSKRRFVGANITP